MPEPVRKGRKRQIWYTCRQEADALGISYNHLLDRKMDPKERDEGYRRLKEQIDERKRELGILTRDEESDKKMKAALRRPPDAVDSSPTDAQRELASRELARRSLLHYIERTHPDYEAGWVHEDICRRLEQFVADVEAKKSPRLMLFLPPRSGKSLIASTYFPAWVLGKHPEWEFIMASYSAELPIGFSRRVRAQLQSPEYKAVFPTTEMSKDSTSAETWKTQNGGGLRASGTSGSITGMGAHCFMIDDPVRDQADADSETIRNATWEWYSSTAYTRLAPGGGMVVVQCMTGDTPVLMHDGAEKPLSDVRPGDWVATFDNGRLSVAPVLNHTCNGYDSCYEITTKAGKVVRANGRHPFLEASHGVLKWTCLKDLKLTSRIVIVKGSTVNGPEKPVEWRAATSLSTVRGFVRAITTRLCGPAVIGLRLLETLKKDSRLNSNTDTVLPSSTIGSCWPNKIILALSASALPTKLITRLIGSQSYASTMTMLREKLEGFFATTATWWSQSTLRLKFSKQLPLISDFILDSIVSIKLIGEHEVFDLQVSRTENFIANGVVSHNTRWHHDDLSGRLIDKMNNDLKALTQQMHDAEEMLVAAKTPAEAEDAAAVLDAIKEEHESIDKWEIVEYQALATADEYLDRQSGKIIKDEDEEQKDPQRFQLLRRAGEALHPQRFPRPLLLKYKATMQPRHWSALYQQNPVPDEGLFFTKDLFRYRPHLPPTEELLTFAAWDLAIGSKNSNDYTVGIAVGIDYQDNLFVLDMLRGKWGDLDKVANYIIDLHTRYNCSLTGIEKGQLELALRPILTKAMRKRNAYIALAEGDSALRPVTDKVVRARPLQGRMQQGAVLFPADQPWVEALRNELLRFPAGVHDDCVDALAWAVRMTSGVAPPKKPSLIAVQPFDGFNSWKDRLSLIMSQGRERNFMAR